jgi:hypothetical protein
MRLFLGFQSAPVGFSGALHPGLASSLIYATSVLYWLTTPISRIGSLLL